MFKKLCIRWEIQLGALPRENLCLIGKMYPLISICFVGVFCCQDILFSLTSNLFAY